MEANPVRPDQKNMPVHLSQYCIAFRGRFETSVYFDETTQAFYDIHARRFLKSARGSNVPIGSFSMPMSASDPVYGVDILVE